MKKKYLGISSDDWHLWSEVGRDDWECAFSKINSCTPLCACAWWQWSLFAFKRNSWSEGGVPPSKELHELLGTWWTAAFWISPVEAITVTPTHRNMIYTDLDPIIMVLTMWMEIQGTNTYNNEVLVINTKEQIQQETLRDTVGNNFRLFQALHSNSPGVHKEGLGSSGQCFQVSWPVERCRLLLKMKAAGCCT